MTTVALLYQEDIKKLLGKLLYGYINFLTNVDEHKSKFFHGKDFFVNRYSFDVKNKIISNQIWVKEKVFGRDHIIISLSNQSKDILKKMASLAITKLAHKKVLFFNGNRSLNPQLEEFSKMVSSEDTFVYCIIFGSPDPTDFQDVENFIQNYFFKASIKIKEFFNAEDIEYCFRKIAYRRFERSSASVYHKIQWEKRMGEQKNKIASLKPKLEKEIQEFFNSDDFMKFQIDYLFSSIINFILEDSYYEGGTRTVELENEDTHICKFPDGSIVEIDQYDNIHLHREEKGMWGFLGTISNLLDNRDIISWIEKLPTHLASILWLSFVEIDIRLKCKYLINFFEGFTQFSTTIMLSSFYLEHYFKYRNWIDKEVGKRAWFKKPTFGSWFEYYKRCTKTIRSLLNSKKDGKEFLELSKISELFWKIITHKGIIPLLEDALGIRNNIAHKGELPDSFYEKSLSTLEFNLKQLWSYHEDAYKTVELIKPEVIKPHKKANTVFHNTKYRIIMGVGIPFRQKEINLKESLAVNRFYLLDTEDITQVRETALELLPLFTIDDKDHCYYFDRFENKKASWKTYQIIQEEIPKFEYLNKDLELIFSHFEL